MAAAGAPATPTPGGDREPAVGNYFVANYPPFSFWSTEQVSAAHAVLDRPTPADVPLGLYVHIPFCRKRCDFCYFKVYTDRNARQISRYLEALLKELSAYAEQSRVAGRAPLFVYFGGGTPSYLSSEQLSYLFEGLRARLPWDRVEEVAFECEPGTLQEKKTARLRELGVTRLSLGIENFDAHILELNNRAHRADEIRRAYGHARQAGFPQINIDLIAGMVGESDENWRSCIEQTIDLAPDMVTIYQMEVPYNTTIYKRMSDGQEEQIPIADWPTKRRWSEEAFTRLEQQGYQRGSAYTATRIPEARFLYRDALWRGADLLSLGVSSFSHVGGVHFQNTPQIDMYIEQVEAGRLPIHRALKLTEEERLIREFVLQLKLGRLAIGYFRDKFGVDVRERFAGPLQRHQSEGFLRAGDDTIEVTRAGLQQIDRLLHEYFLEKHQHARYT